MPPGPVFHKVLSGRRLRKGRTQTVHSRPVRGAGGVVGADGGLSSCNPTLHVSSLGRPPRAKALAVSTGERQDGPRPRCPQDTFKDLGAGPHLPAAQGPAKPTDTGARLGSPSAVLGRPCDLATSSVSSEPCAWVSAAGPLGHTSWAWPPPLPSPQVPLQPAPSASAPRRGHSRPPRLLERRRQGPLPCRRVPLGGPARPGCWDAAVSSQAARVRNPGGARAEHSPAARAATQIPPTFRYK